MTEEEQALPTGAIVVGIDGSHSSHRALEWATEQALADRRPLMLVHALGTATPAWTDVGVALPENVFGAIERGGREILDEAYDLVKDRVDGLEVHQVLEFADARSLLLEKSASANMVVIGSRGRGPVRRLLLGSVGVALSRHSACPLVIHRPAPEGQPRDGILVAADGSAESLPVLEFAYHQAEARSLPLTVMHCFWDIQSVTTVAYKGGHVDRDGEQLELAESLAGMAEKHPDVKVTQTVAHGLPEVVVAAAGETKDLVVVGAHQGSWGQQLMFGSVSIQVVEHAHCVVAVVPLGSSEPSDS
jgi:nucleotide-binding universal stress UspA family protein